MYISFAKRLESCMQCFARATRVQSCAAFDAIFFFCTRKSVSYSQHDLWLLTSNLLNLPVLSNVVMASRMIIISIIAYEWCDCH